MAKLTKRQKRFIEEYLIDLNATQAAIRAGYSPNTAQEIGSENLSKLIIKTEIDKAIAERSRRTGITQDRVLRELAKIAFVNPNDVINFGDATVKMTSAEDLATIASVKVKTSMTKKGEIQEREVKLYDKLRALDLLGKHLGMFSENINVNANVNSTEKLDSILKELGESDE